jgi:uncharacterized SAM-binding protein YcdF (DUF218 family)
MNWDGVAVNWANALLLPPANLIIVGLMGYLLRKKMPKLGTSLSVGAILVLILLSMPVGALLLTSPLEKLTAPLTAVRDTKAQAIVVLGGGLADGVEYDGKEVPSATTLVRLRYAAKLHGDTSLPILVTGGAADSVLPTEAAQMARVLREDFSTPVKWLEDQSHNTAQNAAFSAAILQKVGVQRILLVTDAIHMSRSKRIFERNGFEVVGAPTQFVSQRKLTAKAFIPNTSTLHHAGYAMHEWIGLMWYELRY